MFKRMMILGAVASALALTGCQNRSQQDEPAATGGSGIGGQNYEGGSGGSGTDVQGSGHTGGSLNDQGGGSAGSLGGATAPSGDLQGGQEGLGGAGDQNNVDGMGRIGGSTGGAETQGDVGGSGNLGGSVGDQGATGVDGMDGTDDAALDPQNTQDEASGNQGSDIR